MNTSVSVLIPVFNRSEELRRALIALSQQTVSGFEVIVCDDGSTEDISLVVMSFKEQLSVQYLRIPNSGGPARPRNVAAAAAQGEWIAFLDSDDWWDPTYIERMQRQIGDSWDLIYCRLRVVHAEGAEHQGELRPTVGDPIRGDVLKHMIAVGNPVANSAAMVRKSSFDKAGGLCELRTLSAMEDFDLWLRMAEAGMHFKFVNEVLGNYWVGVDNISTIASKQISREIALQERHKGRFPETLRNLAEACFHDRVAGLYLRSGQFARAIEHLKSATPLPGFRRPARRWAKLLLSYLRGGVSR